MLFALQIRIFFQVSYPHLPDEDAGDKDDTKGGHHNKPAPGEEWSDGRLQTAQLQMDRGEPCYAVAARFDLRC